MTVKELKEILSDFGNEVEIMVRVNEDGYQLTYMKLRTAQEAYLNEDDDGIYEVDPVDIDEGHLIEAVLVLFPEKI